MPDMTTAATRHEHLAWAKERALLYLDGPGTFGEPCLDAYTSLLSDLSKHPENERRYSSELMREGFDAAAEKRTDDLRRWIEALQ